MEISIEHDNAAVAAFISGRIAQALETKDFVAADEDQAGPITRDGGVALAIVVAGGVAAVARLVDTVVDIVRKRKARVRIAIRDGKSFVIESDEDIDAALKRIRAELSP